MNTFAMIICVVGTCLCWVPTWGFLGVAMCIAGCLQAVRGISDKRTSPSALGMDSAAHFFGTIGMTFGTAFQIKHAQGSLDFLVLPFGLNALITITAIAFVIFLSAQLLGRKWIRSVCVTISIIALIVFFAFGTSSFVLADRQGMSLVARQ